MDLQTRVVNILTKPAAEWPVIAAEPSDVASLYSNYILLLAAIPAVSTFLGLLVIGVPLLGTYGFSAALVAGVVSYLSALISQPEVEGVDHPQLRATRVLFPRGDSDAEAISHWLATAVRGTFVTQENLLLAARQHPGAAGNPRLLGAA